MKKCVVVIPIYREELDFEEICSLKNTINVLSNFDIKIVCPESLNTKNYSAIDEFDYIKLDDKHFVDDYAYSRLLLTDYFYRMFDGYEYMLICQTDAWIFDNKLEEWCDKGYDYIGAPWFEGYGIAKENSKMFEYAGNGGFSLRKIKTFINVLSDAQKSNRKLGNFMQVYTKGGNVSPLMIHKIPKAILRYYNKKNVVSYAIKNLNLHEDNIIVNYLRRLYPQIKVAKAVDAKYFSMEVNSRRLYKEAGNVLPFGCHAFKRYDWEFWKEFIKFDCELIK